MSAFTVSTDTYVQPASQKLTPWQRGSIAHLAHRHSMTQQQIADLFGVSKQTVSKIKLGSWQTTRISRVVGVTA